MSQDANQVIKSMGGWPEICKTETDEIKWLRISFKKMYASFSKTGMSLNAPLLGIHSVENNEYKGETILIDKKGNHQESQKMINKP